MVWWISVNYLSLHHWMRIVRNEFHLNSYLWYCDYESNKEREFLLSLVIILFSILKYLVLKRETMLLCFSSMTFGRSNLILSCVECPDLSSFFLLLCILISIQRSPYRDEILSIQRSCTPTSNNKSFVSPSSSSSSSPFFLFYERTRERERKKTLNTKQERAIVVIRSSSIFPSLSLSVCFFVVSNIHHHPSFLLLLLLRLFFPPVSR